MHKKLMNTLALGLFALGVGVSAQSTAYDMACCLVDCFNEKTACLLEGRPVSACTAELNACKNDCRNSFPG
jgi:hypothetical protein